MRARRQREEGGLEEHLPSPTPILGAALCLVFLRTLIHEGEVSFTGPSVETLLHFGGHYAPLVREGELWRLGTAVFLHAGILHIGWNLSALAYLGPAIESVHGRSWAWLVFLVTGVLANVLSDVFIVGVGIGASGALCGLMGMVVGWAHRDGSRELRNPMLRWFGGTMLFGLAIGADNWAHLGGFVSGVAIGWLLPSDVEKRMPRLTLAAGVLGIAGCAAIFAATMAPARSARADQLIAAWRMGADEGWEEIGAARPAWLGWALELAYGDVQPGPRRSAERAACDAHRAGDDAGGRAALAPFLAHGWTPQMIEHVEWSSFCVRVETTRALCERSPHLPECAE